MWAGLYSSKSTLLTTDVIRFMVVWWNFTVTQCFMLIFDAELTVILLGPTLWKCDLLAEECCPDVSYVYLTADNQKFLTSPTQIWTFSLVASHIYTEYKHTKMCNCPTVSSTTTKYTYVNRYLYNTMGCYAPSMSFHWHQRFYFVLILWQRSDDYDVENLFTEFQHYTSQTSMW